MEISLCPGLLHAAAQQGPMSSSVQPGHVRDFGPATVPLILSSWQEAEGGGLGV